jgi:hypothetical protein
LHSKILISSSFKILIKENSLKIKFSSFENAFNSKFKSTSIFLSLLKNTFLFKFVGNKIFFFDFIILFIIIS